ncbi:MAG TPA: DciA family protein [Gaiellales bacterium]|nr:DciA family protein [Gaiellales bacterium]
MSDLQRIDREVRRLGRVPEVDPLVAESRRVWRSAVGEEVARRSLPVRRSGGALVVHCASSSWASELTLLEGRLRRRLTAALGQEAPPLRFEVGDVDSPDPTSGAASPAPPLEPTAEQLLQARALAAGIVDPELRAAAERAIAASLARDS